MKKVPGYSLSLCMSILVITILTLTAANAQQNGSTAAKNNNDVGASQRSYQQARWVLDEGIKAMGGLEALRA
ncbi:MAG TPA: hypothetical protein VL866_10780, partial [Pyrinomonadaceae bacterium]|nr:hypothetical protein [Pyrinomonadaceae bacterium]